MTATRLCAAEHSRLNSRSIRCSHLQETRSVLVNRSATRCCIAMRRRTRRRLWVNLGHGISALGLLLLVACTIELTGLLQRRALSG